MRPSKPLKSPTRNFFLALFVTIAFNSLVLTYFHNRFWWPPDEGVYAHTAERMLHGEVLNSDVEEIHTGYIHFVHAAAFATFGIRLVSLRYPLVAAAFLQSCLIFLIFAWRNLFVAVIAAITATSMGVIQYLNPQPSWYCLLYAIAIALCLTYLPQKQKGRVELVGLLVGLSFFFRQITGVFVAMAVLTYLLTEKKEEGEGKETFIAKGLLILMLVGTVLYLKSATNVSGLLLIGVWPVVFLMQAIVLSKTKNRQSLDIVLRLAIGFVVAALPLLTYHLAHGSLRPFFDDTIVRAINIQQLGYLKSVSFAMQQFYGLTNILAFRNFAELINGLYWLVLPLSSLVTGAVTIRALGKYGSLSEVGALPVLAVFYGLVALFQQIPIYLCYTLPLTFAGLFWLALKGRKQYIWLLCLVTILLSAISIYYHAAQPISRQLAGGIRGERTTLVRATTLRRTGLWIDPGSLKTYMQVLQVIQTNSQPNETLFALPYNPELYFLAERKNPFRFWNTAVGVRDLKEETQVIDLLNTTPPRIIVFAPHDRNNTPSSIRIMSNVRARYSFLQSIGDFEIYRAP